MRDVCDVVYAILVTRLEQQVLAERQVAAMLLTAGAPDVEMPSLGAALDKFDAALLEEPQVVDAERAELLAALGVGGG